jgi:DNA processing protein
LDEAEAWLRLALASGIQPAEQRVLLRQLGLPAAIFDSPVALVRQIASPRAAKALFERDPERDERVARALDWLRTTSDGFLLTLAEADYPRLLLEIADPPILLYGRGRRELLVRPTVAVVGSRKATRQGEIHAHDFARRLAAEGLVVVSGMAAGIDGAAHRGALALGRQSPGGTIAVIGTGIDRIYPASHRDLARQIVEQGLMLSEFAHAAPARPEHFPRRNRLISGLSLGVLVVEAAAESGSLITARLAGEHGREVMALPGSILNPQARGCHGLIKQGAKLVESVDDVLAELQVGLRAWNRQDAHAATSVAGDEARPGEANSDPLAVGDPRQQQLLAALGYDPCDFDELLARSGLSTAALGATLTELELLGFVARLPGGLYQRIGSA